MLHSKSVDFFVSVHADLFYSNMNENNSFKDWLGLVLSKQRSPKIASNDVTQKALSETYVTAYSSACAYDSEPQ